MAAGSATVWASTFETPREIAAPQGEGYLLLNMNKSYLL